MPTHSPPPGSGTGPAPSPTATTGDPLSRRPLTRGVVVATALAFVKTHGMTQLTMRRLGQQLNVEAMSLYHHVNGRADLLEGMVDALVAQVQADPTTRLEPSDGWQAYLQALARSVRRVARDNPQAFPLVATQHPAAPWLRPPLRSLELVEDFLTTLTARGFPDEVAVSTYKTFSSFLLGHLLLEIAGSGNATAQPHLPINEGDAEVPTGDELQNVEDFPVVLRLQHLLAEDRADREFEEALEALLDRLDNQFSQ